MNLTDFLLARIAEDEAEVPERYRTDDYGTGFNMDQAAVEVACPRWLAECEAKRQIVGLHLDGNRDHRWDGDPDPLEGYCELCHDYSKHQPEDWPCRTLRLLALPYSGRPDYRDEWRP